MKYRESKIDKDLRSWFSNDLSKALLRGIHLNKGSLRGVNNLSLSFDYPIVAFAGVNGAGKSTILAMACCAFHNSPKGFSLPRRKVNYYTFSDFFIQHAQEVAPQGIEILYNIAYDKWAKTQRMPDGKGIGAQSRKKAKGGKWNDYHKRVDRNVLFLGIERIVPHSERSQSRSYSRVFKDVAKKGWEDKVAESVGYILSKKYDDFRYLEHSRYSLPVVRCAGVTYSGFNMGAGENALFEIFSNIYAAGEGALFVLDEIELGLHSRAQKLFMRKLKEVCKETSTQIICTTHSRNVFESLPDDARFFVESVAGKTKVTQGISPEFAFRKMGDEARAELYVMVEDDVARSLVLEALSSALRARVEVLIVGSAAAISRQIAAARIREDQREYLAVFDGDQSEKIRDNLGVARRMFEVPLNNLDTWFSDRVCYLPGEAWPEVWMLQKAKQVSDKIGASLSIDQEEVSDLMEYGLQAGKHNEFHEISSHVGLPREKVMDKIAAVICREFQEDFRDILTCIEKRLVL
ncbi:AAA domain [Xanthomonas bromi]|uniref:AAA domain n=1 Tax=Xanthomonas bromi TaxID=56449 RepID=A0A1C3NQV5_9XANT|nr:AAA family ATPase [Xanthomonas bromi]PPV05249.1 hypothetical protein XbrCFBP1976_17930 [Xanthomonas bromi]SBV52765.1 AAA domain [Xanthomonas bromi]